MIETVEHPTFSYSDFSRRGKKIGLTGMALLKNEAEFARASIESIRPYFDEIILVYNDCTDDTPEIVAKLAARYPEQIRAYHYVPKIIALGSAEHRRTPGTSVHSIVHYFGFALSKSTYQVRCMWSGDQIAMPQTFGPAVERLRRLKRGTLAWWLSPWGIGYWWYRGINLWDHQGKMCIPTPRSTLGHFHDHAIWPAGRLLTYKKFSESEYLFTRLLKHHYIGYMFYHLRGMKQDRGTSKYQLQHNPDSAYVEPVATHWTSPPLITLDEFRATDPAARDLPTPESLGINCRMRHISV